MNELIDILEELTSIFNELDNEMLKGYSDRLNLIYSDKNFRHSYAEISIFLEQEVYPDQRDSLVSHIDSMLFYLNNNEYPPDIVKKVAKLADHIQLEAVRLGRIENIKYIGQQIKNESIMEQEKLKENVKKSEELEEELKNVNTQLVSVLGIFTGIVLSIFGGISFFSSVFNNIDNVGKYRLIFIASLTGFILFNLISFMFAALSYLTGKSLSLFPKSVRFSSLNQLHNAIYIITNMVLIGIMIAIFVLWIFF